MTKLTRNIIIGASSTAVAGGAAAGIAVAVVKSKHSGSEDVFTNKDFFKKQMVHTANSIYKESFDHEIDVMIDGTHSYNEEMYQRALQQAAVSQSMSSFRENVDKEREQAERLFAIQHQHEIIVKNEAAYKNEEVYATDKTEAEENIIAMKERVKAEVWQYARAEYVGCQNASWRAEHKKLIVRFTDVYPMTVLARDWFYLLQADSVAQIKHLEKDMIYQIKKQYGVSINSLID